MGLFTPPISGDVSISACVDPLKDVIDYHSRPVSDDASVDA